jgi:UDP-N-acetylglucosamine diphosphorylase/glucosamine-1-phosphate N-acetyltransferase
MTEQHPSNPQGGVTRVCLFEDAGVATLEPLALTRPAFELLCGATSLGLKQRRAFGPGPTGALVRSHLAELCRWRHPDLVVNDPGWLRAGPTVLVNGRWLPPAGAVVEAAGPCVGLVGEEVAYAIVEPKHLAAWATDGLEPGLEALRTILPRHPAAGRVVRYLWELVDLNGEQLCGDFATAAGSAAPAGWALVGPADRLHVSPQARVEPMVLANTTGGPVAVDEGAVVTAFSRLEGPCYVGRHAHVLGAKVRGGTTLGPHSRVGGEVEASIVLGHSNKYHDGFLGHSYVGEWVNLGAGTSTSDLRNDYGEVTVTAAGRRVATGLTKVGSFLGDHTKTGLGTLLNTGTNAGPFCNLLPWAGLLPRYVPPFCRGCDGALAEDADLGRLLATAATVMSRRGAALTAAHAVLYRTLFEQTAAERRRALREAEGRRLRRSA